MDLWIHMMHKQINVYTPVFITLMYPTYWSQIRSCPTDNLISPNIFIHNFIINILSQYIPFKQKIVFWKKYVENPFYSHSQKRDLWDIYMKTQRIYNGFIRCIRLWKIKHAKVKVNTDLYMNSITLKKGRSISIYQNDSLYYFTIPDLINICNSSLMNSPNFFCEPRIPKNPYTNIPFSNANLYSIYDAIRHSRYRMSNLLHLYYLCEFDLDLFYYKHESTIRDEYINTFIKTSNSDDLFPYVREMLQKIIIPNKIKINKKFPQDKLVNIMRPFLKLYLIHSLSLSKTEYCFRVYFELKYKLIKFQEYNPRFGRQIFVQNPKTMPFRKKSFIKSYDMNHIAFNDIRIDESSNLFENKDDSLIVSSNNSNDILEDDILEDDTLELIDDDSLGDVSLDDESTEILSTIFSPNFIINEQNIAENNAIGDTHDMCSDDEMEICDTDSMS